MCVAGTFSQPLKLTEGMFLSTRIAHSTPQGVHSLTLVFVH